jgi:hypothetical protein
MPMRILVAIAVLAAQTQLARASGPIAIGSAQVQDQVARAPPKCEGLVGVWRGHANGPDYQGPLILHVAYAKGELSGVMDAPARSAEWPWKLRLLGFRRHGQRIEFTLPDMSGWYYAGTLSADGSTIRGSWLGVGGLDGFGPRGDSLGSWKPGDPGVPTEFRCVASAM